MFPLEPSKVLVLGGWDVEIGDFTFTLKNIENGKIIKPRKTKWKIQSYEFGERAKKIMVIDNLERGNYLIEFKNQDSLKVWNSNIPFIFRFFQKQAPKQFVQILIK